ncbi:hypothetical protein WJ33_33650 [Burkholderia ubonensis]|uniref:Uncharacterized protein n=1 Tax=Burkholderia ubonensis TaxID=101571 RepID=A0A118HNT1_9BURK|nr:hypothetical protein WJ33_33650 [Burkholderia ubonensis]
MRSDTVSCAAAHRPRDAEYAHLNVRAAPGRRPAHPHDPAGTTRAGPPAAPRRPLRRRSGRIPAPIR